MSDDFGSPVDFLPHGAGLQLLQDAGRETEKGWEFFTTLRGDSSAVSSNGRAVPEVGLELMAQAAGIVTARMQVCEESTPHSAPQGGVVGAVRGYEYANTELCVGQKIRVVSRSEMCDESVSICECELYVDDDVAPRQRARITLIMK